MLFRGSDQPTPDAPGLDAVTDEIKRWHDIATVELAKFRSADGLLNEFKMMWEYAETSFVHVVLTPLAGHSVGTSGWPGPEPKPRPLPHPTVPMPKLPYTGVKPMVSIWGLSNELFAYIGQLKPRVCALPGTI